MDPPTLYLMDCFINGGYNWSETMGPTALLKQMGEKNGMGFMRELGQELEREIACPVPKVSNTQMPQCPNIPISILEADW